MNTADSDRNGRYHFMHTAAMSVASKQEHRSESVFKLKGENKGLLVLFVI
jgi:hypothetical protein